MTVREYNLRRKGEDEKEKVLWERARWQMFLAMQMQPFFKPHSKPKDIRAWISFPWERIKEITREDCKVTESEVEQLGRLLELYKNRRKS